VAVGVQQQQVVIRILAATGFGVPVMPVPARFGGDCRMTMGAFARLSAVKVRQKITSDKLSDHFLLLTMLKIYLPLRFIHFRRRFDAQGAFYFHRLTSIPEEDNLRLKNHNKDFFDGFAKNGTALITDDLLVRVARLRSTTA